MGAGISNWATYYYNTDITPFTIHYLGDDPADDPEIYQKTSPMSYIKKAKTPTLIQHGELDRRVPIANAYELRQGLEDRGVPVEMVVYKGFGHGINKPQAMRAVMRHNLAGSITTSGATRCRISSCRRSPRPRRPTAHGERAVRRIPEGWFEMGSDDGADDERPAHRVWVDAFELAIYPVTCEPSTKCSCSATGHEPPRDWALFASR